MTEKNTDRRRWVLATLEQYEGRLLRFASRMLGDENSARDAVQHSFLRLCRESPEQLDGRAGPWLFTVCRHYAVDLLRRRGNEPTTPDAATVECSAAAPDPAMTVEQADTHDLLRRKIDLLPIVQREAVLLWSEGFPYREIAAMTGATEGNIRVTVHRAFERLRKCPEIKRMME